MTGDIPPFEEAKKRGKMPYPVSVPSHLKNVEFRDGMGFINNIMIDRQRDRILICNRNAVSTQGVGLRTGPGGDIVISDYYHIRGPLHQRARRQSCMSHACNGHAFQGTEKFCLTVTVSSQCCEDTFSTCHEKPHLHNSRLATLVAMRIAMLAACVMMGGLWYEIWMCSSCQQILISTYFSYPPLHQSCHQLFRDVHQNVWPKWCHVGKFVQVHSQLLLSVCRQRVQGEYYVKDMLFCVYISSRSGLVGKLSLTKVSCEKERK